MRFESRGTSESLFVFIRHQNALTEKVWVTYRLPFRFFVRLLNILSPGLCSKKQDIIFETSLISSVIYPVNYNTLFVGIA